MSAQDGMRMRMPIAHALLCLAYEQRTNNLIALLEAGHSTVKVSGVDYDSVAAQIKERLSL